MWHHDNLLVEQKTKENKKKSLIDSAKKQKLMEPPDIPAIGSRYCSHWLQILQPLAPDIAVLALDIAVLAADIKVISSRYCSIGCRY